MAVAWHVGTAITAQHVLLHYALSLAAQCIVIGIYKLEIACIDLHQTGSVDEGSDHLQLIKFWPSCAPGKGVCGRAKVFGSTLLPARSVCVASERFFIIIVSRLLSE